MEQIWEEDQISPISLLGIVLFLLIINFLIILQDYPSFFRHLLHSFLCFLTTTGEAGRTAKTASQCCNAKAYNLANVAPNISNFNNVSKVSPPIQKIKKIEGFDISMKEVGIVMDKLKIFHNHLDGEATKRVRIEELIDMFEVDEPSLDEIREAFDVFDENTDGFIDAKELSKVINALGYGKFSEFECRWLIRPFDENGDGLIDFNEFTKLVEKSFS